MTIILKSLALSAFLLLTGCQIITYAILAPEQFIHRPIELWTDSDDRHQSEPVVPVTLAGTVVDEEGHEILGVKLTVSCIYPDARIVRTLDATFHESIPGNIFAVSFSRDGYYTKNYYGNRHVKTISLSTEAGFEVAKTNPQPMNDLRIVLRKHGPFVKLDRRLEAVWVDNAGAGLVIAPAKPATDWQSATWVEQVEQAPDGCFYLTTSRKDGKIPLVAMSHRKACECYKPEEIRIGVRGQDNGIILYTPSVEEEVWYEMRRAPDTGYQSEITLDHESRQRWADNKRIWFYIKVNGQFGRGFIYDWDMSEMRGATFSRYGARIRLEMQPDRTTNLELNPDTIQSMYAG
jgi:hypothetical protein